MATGTKSKHNKYCGIKDAVALHQWLQSHKSEMESADTSRAQKRAMIQKEIGRPIQAHAFIRAAAIAGLNVPEDVNAEARRQQIQESLKRSTRIAALEKSVKSLEDNLALFNLHFPLLQQQVNKLMSLNADKPPVVLNGVHNDRAAFPSMPKVVESSS